MTSHDSTPTKSVARPSDRDIHRFFDGDLTEAEREGVQAALASSEHSPVLAGKLAGLGEVRRLVREAVQAELDEPLDAEALFARITARIDGARDEAGRGVERPSMERLSAERLLEAPAAARAAGGGSGPVLRVLDGGRDDGELARSPLEDRARLARRRRIVVALVTGLAAAAALAIAIVRPGEPAGDAPTLTARAEVSTPSMEPSLGDEFRQTEVVAVDFGDNVGTVFSVEGEEGVRYAVVWLADEADEGVPAGPSRGRSRRDERTRGESARL